MTQLHFDILIIGAGIAGASIGAELCDHCKIAVLETETQPGYHTTGRSAALFLPTYGPPAIRALTRASQGFFENPPESFTSNNLLSERGVVTLARDDQLNQLDDLIADVSNSGSVTRLGSEELMQLVPLLKPGYGAAGIYDTNAKDVDVAALHQGYLRKIKNHGGQVLTNTQVHSLDQRGAGWIVHTRSGEIYADKVVNAAGAWADEIGEMAGAQNIALIPKRRTVAIISAPQPAFIENMPLIDDIDGKFYLKPDAGKLLISPVDETPSPACDAQPEELDIAICVERIEAAFDLHVRRIENKWAGLRSFVADGRPVAGFDAKVKNFFWLAGQGGYGIQTAPALARLASALIRDEPAPADILAQHLNLDDISPLRLNATS